MSGLSVPTLLSWANVVYVIAVAIAAVGSFLIFYLTGLYTDQKDRELASYQARAGTEIAEANRRAEEARVAAAAANERAARLEKDAADINLRIADLNTSRTLSADQKIAISDFAKAHADTPFDVSVSGGASEPFEFAKSIAFILRAEGWKQSNAQSAIGVMGDGFQIGGVLTDRVLEIGVLQSDSDILKDIGRKLSEVMTHIGLNTEFTIEDMGGFQSGSLHIIVGQKRL